MKSLFNGKNVYLFLVFLAVMILSLFLRKGSYNEAFDPISMNPTTWTPAPVPAPGSLTADQSLMSSLMTSITAKTLQLASSPFMAAAAKAALQQEINNLNSQLTLIQTKITCKTNANNMIPNANASVTAAINASNSAKTALATAQANVATTQANVTAAIGKAAPITPQVVKATYDAC